MSVIPARSRRCRSHPICLDQPLFGLSILHDAAVQQPYYAASPPGYIRLMRDHDDGYAVSSVQVLEKSYDRQS